ncbi:TPR and ankyrin repeat-containing protein 1-like isoform X1 [Haliotis cracherodii]|uniref:TPR and ankyrin repeat-containing protein 1-like isoform X1 n=1 Tax=Haliotis cracherodii TaxID=6455 RepID=UPI0039EB73A5
MSRRGAPKYGGRKKRANYFALQAYEVEMSGKKNRVREMIDFARAYFEKGQYGHAFNLCNEAEHKAYEYFEYPESDLLMDIYDLRTQLYIKQNDPDGALEEASQMMEMMNSNPLSNLRYAQAMRAGGKLADCFGFLVEGLKHLCATEEDRITYFAELASVIPDITVEDDSVYNEIDLPSSSQFWSSVLKNLAKSDRWQAVSLLILGLTNGQDCPLDCVASDASTAGISVSGLLKHLPDVELKKWGIKLAICLLKKGAAMESISADVVEPVPITAVVSAIRTGNNELFRYVMETSSKFRLQIDNKDKNGDTPLHILVKSGKTNSFSGEALLKLLLNYGATVSVQDSSGKEPIDYLDAKTQVYAHLSQAASNSDGALRKRIAGMKEQGNKARQDKDPFSAIRWYKDAIALALTVPNMKQDLAVLHSNCSAVYSSLEMYNDALRSADATLASDPKFHKGYWRKGQALKQLGRIQEALAAFIHAMQRTATTDEEKVLFLTEVVDLLPLMVQKNFVFKPQMGATLDWLGPLMPKVLENLVKSSSFEAIRILILGQDYVPLKNRLQRPAILTLNHLPNPVAQGVATRFNARDVVLSQFVLMAPETDWIDELVIVLLLQGALYNSLKTYDGDTPLHAAVRLCIKSGGTLMFEHVMQLNPAFIDKRYIQDSEGRSLFHTVCECCPSGDSPVSLQMTEVLLFFRFDVTLRDRLQRKATDLVPPHSKLHKELQKKTYAPILEDAKTLKEKGNREFQSQKYQDAIAIYSKAIDVMMNKAQKSTSLADMFSKEDDHDLAVLYGNRAECYLKKNMAQEALDDSMESVAHDGHWHKAHMRVGRSLQALKRTDHAISAFVNAYNSLSQDGAEKIQKEILGELLMTVTQSSKILPGQPIPNLNTVRRELWAKVAYDIILRTAQWGAAHYAYKLFAVAKTNSVKINIDLKPLCDPNNLQRHRWGSQLVLYFLKCEANHHTLRFEKGDTYLHATVFIVFLTADMELLKWLFENIVLKKDEMNIEDETGNTALHMVCSAKLHPDIKVQLLIFLVDQNVSPLIQNRNSQTALDCVPSGEHEARHIMMRAMERDVNGKSVFRKQKAVIREPSPPVQKSRIQEPKQTFPKSNKKQPQRKQYSSQCDRCDETFETGMRLLDEDPERAVDKFVGILLWEHKGGRHQEIVDKCLNKIVAELGRTLTPDLPDSLKKISPHIMKIIMERFAEKDRWRHIEAAIKLYGADRLPKSFAKGISTKGLIVGKTVGSEALKLKILSLLQSHGACLVREKEAEAMKGAIANNEVRVVLRLLDDGISPLTITVTFGDTPVHAALNIALDKDKGNFTLLERLLELHKSDPAKYSYLNSRVVNREGDTLLHMACKCKYNKHSQKAVEFLCNQQVPADVCNKEGKMAIQYLTTKNDRRAQFLRVVGGTVPATKSKTNDTSQKKANAVGKEKTQKKTEKTDSQESSPERTEEEADIGVTAEEDIRVKAVNLVGVAQSRERIKEIVSERQDPEISIFKESKSERDKTDVSAAMAASNDAGTGGASADRRTGSPRKETRTVAERILEEDAADVQAQVDEEDLDEDEEVEEESEVNLSTFDNLAWEVECTADVWKCLRDKHVLPELKQRAIRRILLLANGEWRPYLRKRVNNAPATLELYEAKLSKAARIIWEVAVAFSARCSEAADKRLQDEEVQKFAVRGGRIYSEIIRVWDIVFDHDNLYRSIQNVIKSHSRGETCILKKKLKGVKDAQFEGGITKRYPMLFAEQDDDLGLEAVRDKQQMLLYPPASANETEYHILKFYSFSSALVNIILQNIERKVDFPFRVTDKEHAIIHLRSKSPILLLGRSGTGKTTCCLYRLWTSFISYWVMAKDSGEPFLPRPERFMEDEKSDEAGDDNEDEDDEDLDDGGRDAGGAASKDVDTPVFECLNDEDEEDDLGGPEYDHLHQIFVTKNPVLSTEVHKNFYELCHACEATKDHAGKEADDLPHRLQDVQDLCYPLFLTSKQLLMMLDASLEPPYFFERNEDGSLGARVQGWGTQDDLFGFSPLEPDSDDEDEGVDLDEDVDEDAENAPEQIRPAPHQQKVDPRKEVTYEMFAEEIWPKILKKMSVNYHPSLVWTEIMSFIKGSFEALLKPNGHLSKDEYIELGKKRAPNFTGERDKVYELYLRYDHFKKQKFLFDEADLVQNIYKRLRSIKEQTWVIHQLYVDETQDFTQSELCVLLRITQNPNDMFLTGDTAQGIMRGISFRFSDLKSLFFYARKSLHARGQFGSVNVPKQIYQLTHNYRSHAGILSLASSVLDLMVEFFPESFDRLQKDQGLFNGPPPILLESCSVGDLAILLQGNKRKTSHIEFGAHQAILVVNDSVKNNMPEELSHGIVLTIYEAKGLEFDDVLLYNFFKDSQAVKEWRVVTSFLEQIAKGQEDERTENLVIIDEEVLKKPKRPRPLNFDPNQHKVLNSELKHLYTALTRARVNVWIFDEDEEKRAPMFEYFKARKLVRCITDAEMNAAAGMEETMFAEKSTPEDWVKRGDEMMGRCLYEVAAKCYRMGDNETKEKIAQAHNQALKASRMKDNPKKMKEEFVFAAEKFLESGHDNKAALCLQNAREYELAATVFEKCGLLVDAAKMFRRCKKHVDASRCYEQLGNYHKAVEVLDNEELYDQAIDCFERHKLVVSELERKGKEVPRVLLLNKPGTSFTVARLSYKAANFYHRYKNEAKMVEALERLPRVEDRLVFLKKRSYVEQAATILVQERKTTEAARMMLQHGKVEKALDFALQGDDQDMLGDCHYAQALALMSSKEGYDQPKILEHLTSARDAYMSVEKVDSVGVTCLALASIKLDLETAKKAFHNFKIVKPFANEAGMLESLDLVVQLSPMDEAFADMMAVVRGVDALFNVMKALLKPTTTEEKARCQLYLQFYGLHEKDVNTLIVYPKQKPRCVRVIPDFYANKQEKKQPCVEKEKKRICVMLSFHLVDMLKNWINSSRDSLRNHVSHRLQCKSHMEGEVCPDEEYCPYLHTDYNRSLAFNALEALLWEVHLDSILQSGALHMKGIKIPGLESEMKNLYRGINSLSDESTRFDSCERLLDFLIPEHHHLRNLTENSFVTKKLLSRLSFGKVEAQVRRFLEYSWKFSEKNFIDTLEKRSKSTDWFVRATLFSSLFRLKMDISKFCQQLESDLMKHTPRWLDKRRKYALKADFHHHTFTVVCIGRRFFDVHQWLQESPVKAVMEYAKFVKLMGDRVRLSVFPKMPLFLFWQEVFVCISFFCIAKLSPATMRFVLPATYLATIPLVNATFTKGENTIQELVHTISDRRDNLQIVKDRFLQIVGVIFGSRMNLLRLIFKPRKEGAEIRYLQAERLLVLALVLLTNIGSFVPVELESQLMSTILKLSLPEDAPNRLTRSLQAVKQSRGIVDIVAVLRDLLMQREEEFLLSCYWKWDSQRRQGAQFQQVHRLDSFSPGFHRFDPENLESGNEMLLDYEEEEEELGLTPEEAQRKLEENLQYKENLIRDKAAKKLQRFFRWLTFKERFESGNFIRMCLHQDTKDTFAPFEVTEKMCGVCGMPFQTEELAMKDLEEEITDGEEATGRRSPDSFLSPEKSMSLGGRGMWSPGKLSTPLESHRTTTEHIQKKFQFEGFRRLYEDFLSMKVPEMRKFITRTKLRDQDFTAEHYPDQALDVSRLTSQMDEVLNMLDIILRGRKWDLSLKLREKVVMLFSDYKRVGPEIKEKYKEYVKQQQEVRTETRMVNPPGDEEQKEDWDKETDVVDVVEQPAPRKEFRPRGGGGRGRHRARGQRWEGGRDKGDHRDWEGGAGRGRDRNEREGQKRDGRHRHFSQEDLPPRFQRQQQQRRQKLNDQYQQRRHQVPL